MNVQRSVWPSLLFACLVFVSLALAPVPGWAAGFVVVSGDDADDIFHCHGTNCGGIYPAFFSTAIAESTSGGVGILAIGVNGGAALDALVSWNDPVNGGPGVPVTQANDFATLAALNFSDFAMIYIPSGDYHTVGGITAAQIADLNSFQPDIQTFVNDDGGSLVALTQANMPGGWGFLPVELDSLTVPDFIEVEPTPELLALAPGATAANLSHCCYHNIFTGPAGFSGLDVLAVRSSDQAPVILGGLGTILTAEVCDDGIDNDGDGLVDNDDPDCHVCGDGDLDPGEACDDGNLDDGDGCSSQCVVENQPPVAVCLDHTVSADDQCTACIAVDGGSYDPDGDDVTITESPGCDYSLGSTSVDLEIVDAHGASDTCSGVVTVVDDTPPAVVVRPMTQMWPPNHFMHAFTLSDCVSSVVDNCETLDVDSQAQIMSITSDEPEDARGGGDGHTTEDMVITGNSSFELRAERKGGANGRVYTVEFVVTDGAGNASVATCDFGVPHNGSGALPVEDEGAGYSIP